MCSFLGLLQMYCLENFEYIKIALVLVTVPIPAGIFSSRLLLYLTTYDRMTGLKLFLEVIIIITTASGQQTWAVFIRL